MAEKIGTFKVNGSKVELDLDSIGSYVGGEPIKTYIDNHSGGTGGGKEIIYLNDKSQDEYVELFNRLRPEMLAGNFKNYEIYWRINNEDGSAGRIIRMTDVDVSQDNWLVFGGFKAAFANPRAIIQAAIMNDGVCYFEETPFGE